MVAKEIVGEFHQITWGQLKSFIFKLDQRKIKKKIHKICMTLILHYLLNNKDINIFFPDTGSNLLLAL